jgi:hypothetical protein
MTYSNIDYTMSGQRLDEDKIKAAALPNYKKEHIVRKFTSHESHRSFLLDQLFHSEFTSIFFEDIDRAELKKI